jgi:hypothetical protein
MSDVTVWCLVVGNASKPVGNTFDLKVALDSTISDLAKILAERKALGQWEAGDLSLWKPRNNLADDAHLLETVGAWRLNRETCKEDNERATFLGPSSTVREEFGGKLSTRCVHVLVQLPLDKAPTGQEAGEPY